MRFKYTQCRDDFIIAAAVGVDVGHDFKDFTGTINSDNNCTMFDTSNDSNYERNKVFNVTLCQKNVEQPEQQNYTIVLQDDDGEWLLIAS